MLGIHCLFGCTKRLVSGASFVKATAFTTPRHFSNVYWSNSPLSCYYKSHFSVILSLHQHSFICMGVGGCQRIIDCFWNHRCHPLCVPMMMRWYASFSTLISSTTFVANSFLVSIFITTTSFSFGVLSLEPGKKMFLRFLKLKKWKNLLGINDVC